jgi:hypothetical protein
MAINKLQTLVDNCYNNGQNWWQPFRKYWGLTTYGGCFYDLSLVSGYPKANYYLGDPLKAASFIDSVDSGLWHGGSVSPKEKYIHRIMHHTPNAEMIGMNIIVCDYLLYYPLIDMDNTDEQVFDNTVTLPRYTDGQGVKAFLVATNPYAGGATFFLNYTNQNGVSGRISKQMTCNTTTYISCLVHSGGHAGAGGGSTGPFIDLMPGDFIRSVESITFNSGNGGLATLVLCVPLAEYYVKEANAPAEFDLITMQGINLPRVYDGAYISWLFSPSTSIAARAFLGDISFIWN